MSIPENIDAVKRAAIVAAMHNVFDLESEGPMTPEAVFDLYAEFENLLVKGVDPVEEKGLVVWDIYKTSNPDYCLANSSAMLLQEIHSQSNVNESSIRGVLELATKGLRHLAVDQELNLNHGCNWDLVHAANIGLRDDLSPDMLSSTPCDTGQTIKP